MGEIKFIQSLLMFSLFAIAVIFFAINFGTDNDSSTQLDSDFTTIQEDYSGNITVFVDDSNSSASSFARSTAEPGDQVTSSGKQFKIGWRTLITATSGVLGAGFSKIFGENTNFGIFLSALSGLLIFIGIRYAYKSWFGRNPD